MRVHIEIEDLGFVLWPSLRDDRGTCYDLPADMLSELVEATLRFTTVQTAARRHLYDTGQWSPVERTTHDDSA